MRQLSYIIIFAALASIPASAQPPDTLWTRTFGGIEWEEAYSVQQANDGGFIISGWTFYFDDGPSDIWLIKTDSNGQEEWNQTFGVGHNGGGYCSQQTNDGGFVITGWRSGDMLLIKTDATGNLEWDQTFGGQILDGGRSVQQTADNGYIIVGYTHSFGAGWCDMWLIKTDSTGNEEWNQTFGGTDWDFAYDGQQTYDGGYIIAGSTESFGVGGKDVWLIKTDQAGDEEWNRTFGGEGNEIGWSVQQTTDGGYIITGVTWSFGAGRSDLWLVKTDSNGTEEWNRTFGGSENDGGYSVQQTIDSGYIITGYTKSFGAVVRDLWLIKTDSIGIEEWNKTLGDDHAVTGLDGQQTEDGGYIFSGMIQLFGGDSSDVWLIRLASEEDDVVESTTNNPAEYVLEEICPNPFNSTTTITVGVPTQSELNLNIFNITGQQITTLANERYAPGYHQFTFNADELPSGIYFIHASVPGKMSEVRKVVLIR
ncbi:MAG: T9SS type A sorting domain-containing protein [Candidatus Electryonea clarkiae]|nr:T9SS type A sorting domain-containing protein [Candidatus Electryonea clarkiae]